MASNVIQYPLCSYQVLKLKQLVSHLRLVHSGDPNFELVCGIGGCQQKFCTFSAFNSHVYRIHRAALGLQAELHDVSDEDNPPSMSSSQAVETVESEMDYDDMEAQVKFVIPCCRTPRVLNSNGLLQSFCLDCRRLNASLKQPLMKL